MVPSSSCTLFPPVDNIPVGMAGARRSGGPIFFERCPTESYSTDETGAPPLQSIRPCRRYVRPLRSVVLHGGRTMKKYSEVFIGFDTAKKKHAAAIADVGREGENSVSWRDRQLAGDGRAGDWQTRGPLRESCATRRSCRRRRGSGPLAERHRGKPKRAPRPGCRSAGSSTLGSPADVWIGAAALAFLRIVARCACPPRERSDMTSNAS